MSDQPVTFWHAARDIVAECHAILKPGGVAVFVTKDFVRDKKRVAFSADWARLCESCGFRLVKWARASLVTETVHGSLFDGDVVKRRERKSFFRRLAEKKGSPRIDEEDVLFFVKAGGAGDVDVVVTSPPFLESRSDTTRSLPTRHGGPAAECNDTVAAGAGYGTTPGQMGEMPTGSVDAVVGSPPFAGSQITDRREHDHPMQRGKFAGDETWGKPTPYVNPDAPGQLGAMREGSVDAVVSSPPYAEISTGAGGLNTKPPKHDGQQGGRSASSSSQDTDQRYGESKGQLSRLPSGAVDAVIGSPPWGENCEGGVRGSKFPTPDYILKAGRGNGASDEGRIRQLERHEDRIYGDTPGNLAQMELPRLEAGTSPRPAFDEVTWHHCYDDTWNGLIVDGAFAHPAKMARGLVRRIFDELFLCGALRKGSKVVDPFGGIGTTALEGASRAVHVYICELEPKFFGLANENFALHRRGWTLAGLPEPRVVNGDSRKLRENLSRYL